jgi:hypothetical protein
VLVDVPLSLLVPVGGCQQESDERFQGIDTEDGSAGRPGAADPVRRNTRGIMREDTERKINLLIRPFDAQTYLQSLQACADA